MVKYSICIILGCADKMSLKNVQSSLLSQIGFKELEQQVYLTVLSIGNASLGEIYLQTQIPLEEIQQVVQDLSNRGYLKKIEGKINRYIAVEPFLKGFLFVEKEFQNDIINIENSLINSLDTSHNELAEKFEEFKASIPPIYAKITEELRTANEQLKMDLTNSIYRHSDKVANLSEDFDVMLTDGFSKTYLSINNELSNLVNEISIILRDESEKATERLQKFEKLTNETIGEMLEPIDAGISNYNETIPPKIKEILSTNKAEISELQKNIKSITKFSLKEITNALKEYEKGINQTTTDISSGYTEIITNYKAETKSVFETEKKNLDDAVAKLSAEIGNNIDQLAIESANLKENIEEIAKAGLLKKPDPAIVQEAKERAEKIDKISQTIKSNYDNSLNAYKKNIQDGITSLMKANDEKLAELVKKGKADLKNLKAKLATEWTKIASKYDKDLNAAIKDVLAEANPVLTSTSKDAFDVNIKYLEQLKANISHVLAPLRDVIYTDLEDVMENLFLNSSKRLRLHNETNTKVLENIKYLQEDIKFAFKSQVQEELAKPKQIASEMISEYTATLDNYLTGLDRDQGAAFDSIALVSGTFLTNVKETLATANSHVSNRLAGIIYKVNETKTYLQEITNAVDKIIPVPRPHSLIIYGNTNTMVAISDMLLRTKSTCTVVVPTVDQNLVDLLTKRISKRVRIRILADIDPFRDEALVATLKEQGNISIWQYPTRDYYAVTRDGAEVLLAPATREGELTSFLTEQDSLVRTIQTIINSSFMARSKGI